MIPQGKMILKFTREIVKLNLFNYVLALFRAKFSCNSAFRNPVFRWKWYKNCVWESVKNWSSVCIKRHLTIGPRDWLASDDSPESSTRVKHARSWRIKMAGSQQDKKYSLTILLTSDWKSQLVTVVSDSPVHPVL